VKKLLFIWLEIVLDVMNAQKIFVLAAKSSLTMLEEFAISLIKQNADFVKKGFCDKLKNCCGNPCCGYVNE